MIAKKSKKRKLKLVLLILASLLLLTATACAVYLSDYYHADKEAIAAFSLLQPVEAGTETEMSQGIKNSAEHIDGSNKLNGSDAAADIAAGSEKPEEHTITRRQNENQIVYSPEEPKCGLIFYPGGKVEYTAYEPLMKACAAKGILCVLVEMPFHLAVFDMDAAAEIPAQFPEIEHWYIGGHSLGGSMATSWLADNIVNTAGDENKSNNEDSADDGSAKDTGNDPGTKFKGLVLLGSYSTADLSDSHMQILSVYGSEDGVLNRENYEKYKGNLPPDFTEIVIDGGCHAGFGMYGPQEGDGTPAITNEEQIRLTAEAIRRFTAESDNL